jgi:hypothetical protein
VSQAPTPVQAAKKHLLVIGEENGYRHESVSHAMATIERLGERTELWDTAIRTDTEALTTMKLEFNAWHLNTFDAVLFLTGGELEMAAQQGGDLQSFGHDDGKGFIGVYSSGRILARFWGGAHVENLCVCSVCTDHVGAGGASDSCNWISSAEF